MKRTSSSSKHIMHFFVFFLFFAGIGVLNLFTAIYVDRLQQLTQDDENLKAEKKLLRRMELEQELADIFQIMDSDDSGTLDETELKNALVLLDTGANGAVDNTNLKTKLSEFGMTLETIVVALYKFGNRFKNASHRYTQMPTSSRTMSQMRRL